jgi:hypothetical protein
MSDQPQTIELSDEPHVALIQQVHLTGCMIERVNRHNSKIPGLAGSGITGGSLESIVLRHGIGKICRANRWAGIHRGKMKECFTNAARLVDRHQGRFIYVEGYALRFMAVNHAWVLDTANNYEVIDPTWRETKDCVYLGIPFSSKYLFDQIGETGYFGLLDTPWSRWPVRRLPSADWLHPDADKIPRDFTVPENMVDLTAELDNIR